MAMRTGSQMLRVFGGVVAAVMLLSACSTMSSRAPSGQKRGAEGGGYYKDDGPGDASSRDLSKIPDAAPRKEAIRSANNRPYRALGKTYTPHTRLEPFRQRGMASWYGRRFHGRRTASGERYDMYAMTAAHPTLPIPSYARVTSLENGRSVVVRVNDRGPFLRGRIIDLSYVAASKLGYIKKGSANVEVEQVLPGSDAPARPALPTPDKGIPVPKAQPPMPVFASNEGYAASAVSAMNSGAGEAAADRSGVLPESSQETANREAGGGQYSNAEASSGGQATLLQLGVFASRINAEGFRARVSRQLDDPTVKMEPVPENAYFRVYLGPYASPDEARRAAGWVEERTGIQPYIVRQN